MKTKVLIGFYCLWIQRKVRHKGSDLIWGMVHKMRSVFGLRSSQDSPSDRVSLDGDFFETLWITRKKSKPLKLRRSSESQATMLVSVAPKPASERVIPKKYKANKWAKYVKMNVVHSSKNGSVEVIPSDRIKDNWNQLTWMQ